MCFLVPAAGRLPMRQSAPLSRRRCLQRCLLIPLEKVCEGWHSCSWTLPCQDISSRMTRRYIVDLYRPNFWPAKEFLMSVRARKWNPTKFVEQWRWNYIFCIRWIAFLSLTLRTSMDQYGVYRCLLEEMITWTVMIKCLGMRPRLEPVTLRATHARCPRSNGLRHELTQTILKGFKLNLGLIFILGIVAWVQIPQPTSTH